MVCSGVYIDYNLIHMDRDVIILSFFFDFIQLEIQATNIVNDINTDILSTREHKCLNYPIKKLFLRSILDSSHDMPFYANEQDKICLKKKNAKNVPVFVRYCIDLILNEIGNGDLLELDNSKKYKYIRDIPMVYSICITYRLSFIVMEWKNHTNHVYI